MKRFFLLCMLFSVAMIPAKSQENSGFWSIKAGVNFANFTNMDYTSNCQTGFNVGINRAFSVSKQTPLYIQSGVAFEMKGAQNSYSIDGVDMSNTIKIYAVEIPLVLNFGLSISKNSTLHPFVGVYYSVAVSGDIDYGDSSSDPFKKEEVTFSGSSDVVNTSMFSRSDFGIRAGLDYKFKSYLIGIAYDAGLTNIYSKEFSDRNYEASTGSFSINLGYCF